MRVEARTQIALTPQPLRADHECIYGDGDWTHGLSRHCPICGHAKPRVVQELPNFQFFTDAPRGSKRFTLREMQCRHCLALYRNPAFSPEGFAALFAEAGRSYGHGHQAAEQVGWLLDSGLLRDGAVVLDVGCGSGRFLSALPEHCTRLGIEPDAQLVRQCHDAGLTPFAHEVDAPHWRLKGQVDLITLWHVLEHLPYPVRTLTRLRAQALPTTRLIIEIPVLEHGATPDITGFFSPQHVTHFSRHTATVALEQAGWQVERLTYVASYNGLRFVCAPSEVTPHPQGLPVGTAQDIEWLASYTSRQALSTLRIEDRLTALDSAAVLVIWGAGLHTESLYQLTSLFRRMPERRYLLVDTDPLKQGHTWRGVPIGEPTSTLATIDWDEASLLVSSYGDQAEIAAAARTLVPATQVITLYDQPVSY